MAKASYVEEHATGGKAEGRPYMGQVTLHEIEVLRSGREERMGFGG